jgi:hypothetical protein
MNRYVKNIREFLTEALNKTEWQNYKTDTALVSPQPDSDIMDVATLVMRLLNVDDPAQLLLTGDDMSISQDYRYFVEKVIPESEKEEEGTQDGPATTYYTLYSNGDKFFVKLDVRDMHEYSYIFIRSEDYDYFNQKDAPTVPQPTAAAPAQAAPAPAQPGAPGAEGGGGGLL